MIKNEEELKKLDIFLEHWKEKVANYIMDRIKRVDKACNIHTYFPKEVADVNIHDLVNYLKYTCNERNLDFEEYKEYLVNYRTESKKAVNSLTAFELAIYSATKSNRNKLLLTKLSKEAELKKKHFITSVENTGGQIVRILDLYEGETGILNGYISCERCDVEIETIIAGGYHIQRAHFRVLVKPLGLRRNKNIEADLKSFVPKAKIGKEQEDYNTFVERTLKHLDLVKSKKGSRIPSMQKNFKSLGYEDYFLTKLGYKPLEDFLKKGYLVYEKEVADKQIILGMTFCFYVKKDLGLPYNKRYIEIFNVERDTSVERIKERGIKEDKKEYELLAYLMPKNLKNPLSLTELVQESRKESSSYKIISTGDENYDHFLTKLVTHYQEVNKKSKGRGDVAWDNIRKLNVMEHFKRLGYVEHPNIKMPNSPFLFLPNQKSEYDHVDYHNNILTPLFMLQETYINGKPNSRPKVFDFDYHSMSDITSIGIQERKEEVRIMADMLRKKPYYEY